MSPHMPATPADPVIETPNNSSREVDVTAFASLLGPGNGDWTPPVLGALEYMRDNDYGGLFYPGLAGGDEYRFFQPAADTASIDLRGTDGFGPHWWRGEGDATRLCMYGDGRNAAWYLLWLRYGMDGFTMKDLVLDGRCDLLGGVLDEQTHLIRLGAATTAALDPPFLNNGGVANVKLINVDMTRAHGTGLFAVGARDFGLGDEVEGVEVVGGRYYNNRRGCIDGQRVTRRFLIKGVRFEDGPLTTDQLVDFEGTGAADAAEDWGIDGCDFIYGRHGQGAHALTMGGISDARPAYRLRLTNSRLIGGNALFTDNVGLLISNVHIEGNPQGNQPTLEFNSRAEDVQVTDTFVRRPSTAGANQVVFADATSGTGRPKNISFAGLRAVQETDSMIMLIENGDGVKVNRSFFHFRNASVDKVGIQLAATTLASRDWDVSGNTFIGNEGGGALAHGCQFAAAGASIERCKYNDNQHRGVTSSLRLQETGGSFIGRPWSRGNQGASTGITGLSSVDGVNVGGVGDALDSPVEVIYAADSDPPFSAPDGSVAIRLTNSTKGRTRYTREAGNWGTAIIPASSADFTNRGLPAPTAGWRMQDAAGNLAATVGAATLNPAGTVAYQQAVPGWTELAVQLDETAAENLALSNQALYNPAADSVAWLLLVNFISAAAVRVFLPIGGTAGTALWVGIGSTGLIRLNGGGVTVDGVRDHRRHVMALLACHNRTALRFRVFTPRETDSSGNPTPIVGPYQAAPTNGGNKGIGGGLGTPPVMNLLGGWLWVGAGAETIDSSATLPALGWV